MNVTLNEQKSILTIGLLAVFCDDENRDAAREHIKRIIESRRKNSRINAAALYEDVIMNRCTIDKAANELLSPESRRLAYELAEDLCNADGAPGPADCAFLAALRTRLAVVTAADKVRIAADEAKWPSIALRSSFEIATSARNLSVEEQFRAIMHYAVLIGALEVHSDSRAASAITPLLNRLVYRIGISYEYEPTHQQIREFLAKAGIGKPLQYVDQISVMRASRLLGKPIEGTAKSSGGAPMAFATTYAVGHLARRYYAADCTFSPVVLKYTYEEILVQAWRVQGRVLPHLRARAEGIDVSKLLDEMV